MSVPIPKEAFEPRQAERLTALDALHILDTPTEPAFDDLARLAAEICEADMAAVSFLAGHRQWFKAAINLPRETPISQSFCMHVVERDSLMVVEDATKNNSFAGNALVTGKPGIRFYAGTPIHDPAGTALGALCVIDSRPRPGGLTDLQQRALSTLAVQVERLLEMRLLLAQRDAHMSAQHQLTSDLTKALHHDVLTGLPNRAAFYSALKTVTESRCRNGGRAALLLVDLDHFKQVNDWLGHDAGDAVLRDFAIKLRGAIRAGDIVARLGGDEFGIILRSIENETEILRVINSITERLREPMNYRGRAIEHRQSAGVAIYPDHASCADDLFRNCDLALAEAKEAQRDTVIFDPAMSARHCRHMELLQEARAALGEGRIVAYYQPKVDLRTGQAVGFEALARHLRPGVGAEHPDLFGALFEDATLSRSVTDQVLEQILADIRRWNEEGIQFGHVALNASSHDFTDDGFGERLIQRLKVWNVDPSSIQIEVTETVLLGRGQKYVARALGLLHENGIKIVLDDFGTGHASLIHLKRFPVHGLKIDRSFIEAIERDYDDAAIVRATIGLGRSLGLETVAEGIETVEQLRKVAAKGCDLGQGYLFSPAVSGDQVGALTQMIMPHA